MNQSHFDDQMHRLCAAFDKTYTDAQQAIIFSKTKHWNDETFGKVVDHLIKTCSTKPSIASFFKAIAVLRQDGEFGRDESGISVPCSRCHDCGLLRVYYMSDDPNPVERHGVARCGCQNASNWTRKIPVMRDIKNVVREERLNEMPIIFQGDKNQHLQPVTTKEEEERYDEVPF